MSDYGGIIVNGSKSVQLDSTIKDLCILFSATTTYDPNGYVFPGTTIQAKAATIDHSQIPDYVSVSDVIIYGAVVTPTTEATFTIPMNFSGIYVTPESGTTKTRLQSIISYSPEIFAVGFAKQQKPDYGIIVNDEAGLSTYSSQFKSMKMILHHVSVPLDIFGYNFYVDLDIPTNITKVGVIANQVPCWVTSGSTPNSPGRLMGCKCVIHTPGKLRFTLVQTGMGPPNQYGIHISRYLDVILVDCSHL